MQEMQAAQAEGAQQTGTTPVLLSATAVGRLLGVDPTTIYRMAADGRLPATKVGKQWRFRPDDVAAAFPGTALAAVPAPASASPAPAPAEPAPAISTGMATALTEVAAGSLGVMMVVTDMSGVPITDVANPCAWYAEHSSEPAVVEACVGEWRTLADDLDLSPRFVTGPLGFDCARAFVRRDHRLVAMVLAGGVEPATGKPSPGFHHLDEAGRAAVLDALPRVAAALARATDDPR